MFFLNKYLADPLERQPKASCPHPRHPGDGMSRTPTQGLCRAVSSGLLLNEQMI